MVIRKLFIFFIFFIVFKYKKLDIRALERYYKLVDENEALRGFDLNLMDITKSYCITYMEEPYITGVRELIQFANMNIAFVRANPELFVKYKDSEDYLDIVELGLDLRVPWSYYLLYLKNNNQTLNQLEKFLSDIELAYKISKHSKGKKTICNANRLFIDFFMSYDGPNIILTSYWRFTDQFKRQKLLEAKNIKD